MAIREQIMALYDGIIVGVIPSFHLQCFITKSLSKAADLAEAREKELSRSIIDMAIKIEALKTVRAQMISELSNLPRHIDHPELDAIINKYEVKK